MSAGFNPALTRRELAAGAVRAAFSVDNGNEHGEALDVCYWHLADIDPDAEHVRF
jgi:hypothetical protein